MLHSHVLTLLLVGFAFWGKVLVGRFEKRRYGRVAGKRLIVVIALDCAEVRVRLADYFGPAGRPKPFIEGLHDDSL
jgi:hypothetical protein